MMRQAMDSTRSVALWDSRKKSSTGTSLFVMPTARIMGHGIMVKGKIKRIIYVI
jgi:hypothetical protein